MSKPSRNTTPPQAATSAAVPVETPPVETPPVETPPTLAGEMVEVVLKVSLSGQTKAYGPGDTFPCSAAEAKRLRDAGYAEPE